MRSRIVAGPFSVTVRQSIKNAVAAAILKGWERSRPRSFILTVKKTSDIITAAAGRRTLVPSATSFSSFAEMKLPRSIMGSAPTRKLPLKSRRLCQSQS